MTYSNKIRERLRISTIILLTFICSFLTVYFHFHLKTGTVFTHFFYIPIILAALWFRKKGLFAAIFLVVLLILSHNFIREEVINANDYLRAIMFIVIALVVAALSERIANEQEKSNHLNAILRGIQNVNQLIVMEKDLNRLIKKVCENLIDTRGYYSAWIVLVDKNGKFITAVEAGLEEYFLPVIEMMKQGEFTQCGQNALEQSGIVIFKDVSASCPGCPLVSTYNDRAAMTVRIEHDNRIYGFLSVSTPAKMADDAFEQALFKEVAGDIGFAMHDIELEETRKQAEEALKLLNEELELKVKERTAHLSVEINERKQAEERIIYLNLILRSVRDVNQLITKEKNRDELLQGSCNILTCYKGYDRVWIALFDEEHKFVIATESGLGEYFQPLLNDLKKGKLSNCIKMALNQPGLIFIKNPKIECADCPFSNMYEEKCAIVSRLEYNEKIYGYLGVRFEKKYIADEEMLDLFAEVTGDIAFALYRLELEAAHKQAEESLRQSEKRYRTLVEGAGQPIFTMNRDGVFLFMNETAADSLGGQPDDFVDKTMWDIFPKNTAKLQMSNITRAIESGESLVVESESVIQGERRWYNTRMHPLRNISGEIGSVLVITLDITERKRAEEQIKKDLEIKSTLLQEVHHRVKNNMQIISSLLKLQSAHIKDKRALELFKNSQDRVKTMSLIHDALYRSKDLTSIDFADYVRKLTTQIFISYGANTNLIKFKLDIKDILLDISTAISCGLIINELVSNSLKYAFPKGRKGEIVISFTYKDQVNTLCVKDNGIGFPEEIDLENSPTLGLLLVNSLTKQLDGTLKLEKVKGTSFKITFKKTEIKTYGKVKS